MTGKRTTGGIPSRAGRGVELRCGPNGLLRATPLLVAAAAVLAIFISPAGAPWKALALCVLVLVTWIVSGAARNDARQAVLQITPEGAIRLGLDGASPARAILNGNPWACRWFSFLELFVPESGIHYHGVICASGNPSGEYRRLLSFLRMRSPAADTHGTQWL